jgi:hypothetical protein
LVVLVALVLLWQVLVVLVQRVVQGFPLQAPIQF